MNRTTASPVPRPRRSKAKPSPRKCRMPGSGLDVERLEERCLLSGVTGYRPISEVGNNVANPNEGTAGTDLLRLSPADYANGYSTPSLPNNPGARVISDVISNQADAAGNDIQTVNQSNLSDFGYVWGQFIDHDMDLTPTTSGEFFNIAPDPNDPSHMATQTFERSTFDPTTGTGPGNPRQQVNADTSFLDLSQVYGSTDTVANALRTFSGGYLKVSPGNLLPFNNTTYFTVQQLAALNMANDAQLIPSTQLFAAGDVRANENVELTALQILFVRNHNRIASELQQEHPDWSDEQLYQEARKLNIATEQMITYNDYLPDLLGKNAIAAYTGYNPNVDPAIATEFSTVAFRFGHSLLSNLIQRQDNIGNNIADQNPNGAPIDLAQDFFDPTVINPSGVFDPVSGHTTSDIDAILKGDADGDAQAMDVLAVNEIRNLLFANGAAVDNGQDLIARDIQRARDDGIGTYNDVRAALGLPRVTSFAQITSNVTLQNELEEVYGTVDNIDPFVGGMAEDHVAGSNLGPLFQSILVDQFTRLRDGDRFFYLNESFNQDELNILNQAPTLAKVIEANTGVTNLQSDVFVFKASISGTVFLDLDGDGGHMTPGELGLPGFTLQLQDTSGDVLATTMTDRNGNYTFTQQSGPSANPEIAPGVSATGDYVIVLVLPSQLQSVLYQTTTAPGAIHISRGGINVQGVDFGVGVHFSALSAAPTAAGAVSPAFNTGVLVGGMLVPTSSSTANGSVTIVQLSSPPAQGPDGSLTGWVVSLPASAEVGQATSDVGIQSSDALASSVWDDSFRSEWSWNA
jgi:peroxidase